MDLSTTYLGLRLAHPLVCGASPLVDDLDMVRRLEDAGTSAIVMHSLFEEQIEGETLAHVRHREAHSDAHAEARSYLPEASEYHLGPEEYLEQIRRIRAAVKVPVIASLNGTTPGAWLSYAKLMEQAGASALELNLYELVTDPEVESAGVERRAVEVVESVCGSLSIPVAVKLSPFYTALSSFAKMLERAGADGLVLFNRFYQPDIDVENLEVLRTLRLSDPSELNLRLRWLAILRGNVRCSLAASGGIHGGLDAVKAVMAGADAVQMVSAVLRHGPQALGRARNEMHEWMLSHEYVSVTQMRGSMSLERCPDPRAFERANYIHILQSWRAGSV
ncbi:MAG: dihydroorotate dehydrogenase-like protein [Planctomycetota bacterium]